MPLDGVNVQNPLGTLPLKEYFDVAKHRKWWIILVAIAMFVGATVVAVRMPNIYKAETVILVDPQKVPDNYVPTTVSSTVSDRLSTIRQIALSPTRLEALIEEALIEGLQLDRRPDAPRDRQRLVQKLQKSITIEVGEFGGQRLSSFKICYFGSNPGDSASIANKLAALVIRDNLQAREQQFSGTAQFLDTELNNVKRQLEAKEMEVQRIKSQNVMDLPESKQYHLEALNGLREQLRVSQDRLIQLQQNKAYLKSTMTTTAPTVDLDGATAGPRVSPHQTQIQQLETRLSELQVRYGPSHPDVRKLQTEINNIKKKAAQDDSTSDMRPEVQPTATRKASHNPVLEAEISKIDDEMAKETKLQAELEPQIEQHLSKLQRLPVFEQKLSDEMRDYETLNSQYNQLLNKKLSAAMAKELDAQQQGERFIILDSAAVPTAPYGPNRPLIMLAGLLGGLLGGFALAIIVDLADPTVRSEREASEIFGRQVLAGVPVILMPAELRARFLRGIGMITGTALGASLLAIGISYLLRLVS
jgi:polysaccharide chain length determinant protein (PEP-CTERM system associated)